MPRKPKPKVKLDAPKQPEVGQGVAMEPRTHPISYPRPVYQETMTVWSTGKVTTEKTNYPKEY